MSGYVCERLATRHDRRQFDCGVTVLNQYLANVASQDVKRKAAAVFVMVPRSQSLRVAGYYTLCTTSVELTSLPREFIKRLPRYPNVPAILIGRLARDIPFPGLGSLLLANALGRCALVASEIAASVIVVDTKGEETRKFYEKFGFLSLPNLPHRMFLPMSIAEELTHRIDESPASP